MIDGVKFWCGVFRCLRENARIKIKKKSPPLRFLRPTTTNSNYHYDKFFGIRIFYIRCVLCHDDKDIHIICNHNNTKLHKKKINEVIKMMKTYLYPDLINLVISYLPYINKNDAPMELRRSAYRLCE